MRVPTYHDRRGLQNHQTMTSMIDIVFLLLIFFVCASIGQMRELFLPTELSPGIATAEQTAAEQKTVTLFLSVDSAKRLEIRLDDGETTEIIFQQILRAPLSSGSDVAGSDIGKLQQRLQQQADDFPASSLILDSKPNVPMGDLLTVYHLCGQCGFQTVHIATDPQRVIAVSPHRSTGQ